MAFPFKCKYRPSAKRGVKCWHLCGAPPKVIIQADFCAFFSTFRFWLKHLGLATWKNRFFFRKIENMQMNVHLHTTSSSFPFQFSRAHFMASEGKSPNWNTVHSFFKKQKAGDESTYYANEADWMDQSLELSWTFSKFLADWKVDYWNEFFFGQSD